MENKYLEKIANHYSLPPHSEDKSMYDIESVSLNEHGFKKYQEGHEKATTLPRVLGNLGAGAGVGYGVGALAHKAMAPAYNAPVGEHITHRVLRGPTKGVGAVAGLMIGANALSHQLHDKGMEHAGAAKWHDYLNNLDKKASDNAYIEKVANAYKRFLASKGQDVSGMSSSSLLAKAQPTGNSGNFTRMSTKAEKLTSTPRPAQKGSWFKADPLKDLKAKPLSAGAEKLKATLAESKTPLNKALAAKATATAESAGKGFLNKAVSMVKKNPLIAAGGALAGGALLGSKLHSNNQPAQPQYAQYM